MKRTILFFLIIFLFSLWHNVSTSSQQGQLLIKRGRVMMKKGSGVWKAAQKGSRFDRNSFLKTGGNSSALLRLPNGSRYKLGANTVVMVRKIAKSNIQVNKGFILAKVKKLGRKRGIRVSTVSSVAGVRGTLFSVAVTGQRITNMTTRIFVKEGLVEVTIFKTGEKIMVPEGHGLEIGFNKPPSRIKTAEEWKKDPNNRVIWDMSLKTPVITKENLKKGLPFINKDLKKNHQVDQDQLDEKDQKNIKTEKDEEEPINVNIFDSK